MVRDAYRLREPVPGVALSRRLLLAPAIAILLAVVTLSPAGATVGRWIRHALGVPHAAPALFRLPASGSVLVSGAGGTWTVAADGSSRRLGPWRQASWSPHGLFVAVTRKDELAAVDPHGTLHWALRATGRARPALVCPDGLSGRVPVGPHAASGRRRRNRRSRARHRRSRRSRRPGSPAAATGWPTSPARARWWSATPTPSGSIWTAPLSGPARELSWSSDGRELLVVTATRASLYDAGGHTVATIPAAAGRADPHGSLSPDGKTLALIRGAADQDAVVLNVGSSERPAAPRAVGRRSAPARVVARRPLAARQLARRRSVGVRPGRRHAEDRRGLAHRPPVLRAPAQDAFPRIEGWCCTTSGNAG